MTTPRIAAVPITDAPAIDSGMLALEVALFPLDMNSLAVRIAELSKAEIMALARRIAGQPNGHLTLCRLEDASIIALYRDD